MHNRRKVWLIANDNAQNYTFSIIYKKIRHLPDKKNNYEFSLLPISEAAGCEMADVIALLDPSIDQSNPYLSADLLSRPNVAFCDTSAYLAQNEDLVWSQINKMIRQIQQNEIRIKKAPAYEKVVFFDLDGILLDSRARLNQKNRSALIQLKRNHCLPVVVSGRAPWEIEAIMGGITDTYVSLNGQVVVVNNQVVNEAVIDPEIIENMVKFSTHRGHALAFYSNQEARLDFVTETAIKLYQLDQGELPKVQPNFYKREKIHMLYLLSEEEKKDIIYQCLFDEYLTMVRDSPYSVTMTARGHTKKTGILQLLQALGMAGHTPTYAFGTSNNDLSMFELADYTIAMENGTKEIRLAADFVTKSNEADGIIVGLKQFGLIK